MKAVQGPPLIIRCAFDGGKRDKHGAAAWLSEILCTDGWHLWAEAATYMRNTTSTTAEVTAMADLIENILEMIEKIKHTPCQDAGGMNEGVRTAVTDKVPFHEDRLGEGLGKGEDVLRG